MDASAQVAHAISVDKVVQEYDYFTAVDDCAADDNAGAGMLGTVGYNSSTLFRYATVNLDSLVQQLGDAQAAAEGLAAFIEAFVRSMPTGKQNTFANRTLPNAFSVAFREAQPINPVSAFEKPVVPVDGKSISEQAISRLARRLASIELAYGIPAAKAWCVLVDKCDDEACRTPWRTGRFEDACERREGSCKRDFVRQGGMMAVLLLRLAGPLQSWGDSSRFVRRTTRREPTKSGIVGLLAAALGRSREESIDDLAQLEMGVRIDQKGRLTRDFQTERSLDGKKTMPLSHRYYCPMHVSWLPLVDPIINCESLMLR